MYKAITVYVWHGRAYLPVQGRVERGAWTNLDPVHVAQLNEADLVHAMQEVLAVGHPMVTEEEWEAMKQKSDSLLKATKARSWKQLAKEGAAYSIAILPDQAVLYITMVNRQGKWEFDPAKTTTFAPDTNLSVLAQVILDDVRSRNLPDS